jgi:hypothetical protein
VSNQQIARVKQPSLDGLERLPGGCSHANREGPHADANGRLGHRTGIRRSTAQEASVAVNALTESLAGSIQLVLSNARLAATVAVAYARLAS